MPDWLQLYHMLPYPARVLAASARGYYLHFWRYDSRHEEHVQAALERENWSTEKWRLWQEQRLAYVLYRAANQVPYYRALWSKRRRRGERSSWEYLENWPILNKEEVRRHPEAFLADDCSPRSMFHEHTSGTTGKSLDLWWSKDTVRQWYALFEARWRRWYGVARHDRWAILGGQLITPVEQREPPFWVWNHGLNQLYMSSYHLAPDLIPHYLDALKRYRPAYLYGYTSSLYSLAQGVLRAGYGDLQMEVVITNAEPLFDYQRQAISQAFDCPVRETYGMAEIVAAASECKFGTLHLWPEVGLIEVDSTLTSNGTNEGDLICTGLLNADMPLIRYRVGDTATLSQSNTSDCRCGRCLPGLAALTGRTDDVLYTEDGRRIGRLDPIFKTELPIVEAQIIQESLKKVRVRYVPAENFTAEATESIATRLRQRMGPSIEVVFEIVEQVPRSENGKFRAVICNVTEEELHARLN